jgi:hypothetical protein
VFQFDLCRRLEHLDGQMLSAAEPAVPNVSIPGFDLRKRYQLLQ